MLSEEEMTGSGDGFFKQKTAYEIVSRDWSSDVCSSDLNLAVICEAAAVNHRQKKMGYNAAQELYRRVQENLTKKSSDDDE